MSNKYTAIYQIQNHFQTTIRNVGLYTSISLALLGVARYYYSKNPRRQVVFLLLSLIFTIITLLFDYFLLQDHDIWIDQTVSKGR